MSRKENESPSTHRHPLPTRRPAHHQPSPSPSGPSPSEIPRNALSKLSRALVERGLPPNYFDHLHREIPDRILLDIVPWLRCDEDGFRPPAEPEPYVDANGNLSSDSKYGRLFNDLLTDHSTPFQDYNSLSTFMANLNHEVRKHEARDHEARDHEARDHEAQKAGENVTDEQVQAALREAGCPSDLFSSDRDRRPISNSAKLQIVRCFLAGDKNTKLPFVTLPDGTRARRKYHGLFQELNAEDPGLFPQYEDMNSFLQTLRMRRRARANRPDAPATNAEHQLPPSSQKAEENVTDEQVHAALVEAGYPSDLFSSNRDIRNIPNSAKLQILRCSLGKESEPGDEDTNLSAPGPRLVELPDGTRARRKYGGLFQELKTKYPDLFPQFDDLTQFIKAFQRRKLRAKNPIPNRDVQTKNADVRTLRFFNEELSPSQQMLLLLLSQNEDDVKGPGSTKTRAELRKTFRAKMEQEFKETGGYKGIPSLSLAKIELKRLVQWFLPPRAVTDKDMTASGKVISKRVFLA
ncbi:hypothetical protein T439DRAFT_96094 [Meredithblackwellia eburnea MCA 4105]